MSLNFRTLDLNLLRVFDVVMSEGSLTKSAHLLSITQPAVSHAIRRLREAVGEELFTRTATGVQPTPRAVVLWPQVRAALGVLRQALAPEVFNPLVEARSFRLSMADATALTLCPWLIDVPPSPAAAAPDETQATGDDAVAAAAAPWPEVVNWRIVPLTTRDPRRLLHAGEADAAVGYFPEALAAIVAEGADSPWQHQRLYETRYVCVMRREHPLAAQPAVSLDEFCDAEHLLVSFSGKPHGYVDEALAARGRRRRVQMTVNQFATAGQVVRHSDLLTTLPEGFVQATGCQADLVIRELPLPLPGVHVEMVWHRRHQADAGHAWMRDRVRAAAATRR